MCRTRRRSRRRRPDASSSLHQAGSRRSRNPSPSPGRRTTPTSTEPSTSRWPPGRRCPPRSSPRPRRSTATPRNRPKSKTTCPTCSPYALQKQAGESYCRLFTELYGCRPSRSGISNVLFARNCRRRIRGALAVHQGGWPGSRDDLRRRGTPPRDFAPTSMTSWTVRMRAVDVPCKPPVRINVATGISVRPTRPGDVLGRIVGPPPAPVHGAAREGDDACTPAPTSPRPNGCSVTFVARIPSFEEGLRRTVEWAPRGLIPGGRVAWITDVAVAPVA